MKKVFKEDKYILLSFFVPFVIMTWVLMVMQFAPFGKFSMLISDGTAQEIDRITGFRDIVLNHRSFLYSWGQMQGSTPFAFINFNPSYLLFLLVSDDQIVNMVTWTTIIKIACAGATCAFYLKKTFSRNDISISIFSWCYALMSFGLGFHFILGWEEQVVMLPLVLYGVEKILRNRKDYLFFTFSLMAIFFMYYYFGFMTGIFAFLYFIYRYFFLNKEYKAKDFFGKLGSFMISPIVAFGCTSFLLIPIMYMLKLRDNMFEGSNLTVYLRYNFEDFISKLYLGSFDTYLPGGYPFIYCGLIVLIMIGFYFCSYAVRYKEKLMTFIFLCFMFLSLSLNPLYVAWHGFKPPVYFEGRFSYLVSFLMIFVGYQGYCRLKTVNDKQLHIIFLVITACFLWIRRNDFGFIRDTNVLYTLGFIALYFIVALLYYRVHYEPKKVVLLLAVVVAFELMTNAYTTFSEINELSPYPSKQSYDEATSCIKQAVKDIKQQDDDFYRIEFTSHRGMNDGFGQGYASISHFDSTYNYKVKEGIGAMGIAKGHNWLKYEGSTPIVDMLLNIKYVVSGASGYYKDYYEIKKYEDSQGEKKIYENPYAVSVGFMSHSQLKTMDHIDDPLAMQQEMLEKITGDESVKYFHPVKVISEESYNLKKLAQPEMNRVVSNEEESVAISELEKELKPNDYLNMDDEMSEYKDDNAEKANHYYKLDTKQEAGIVYELNAAEKGPYFIDLTGLDIDDSANLVVNGRSIILGNSYLDQIICIGSFSQGDSIKIEICINSENFCLSDAKFYCLKLEELKQTSTQLKDCQLKVTKYTDTEVEGSIVVQEDAPYLYTSIPYDEGWKLYVDGKAQATCRIMNILLGAKLTTGKHAIKLIYRPEGMKKGIIVSSISWGVVIMLFTDKMLKNIKMKKLNR